jgi:hypothetical protein|tara:strand:- start:2787 stop:3218 length:432 start_codon:yes stop_codon:yes gene_type:complete
MILLTTSALAQEISVIPRTYTSLLTMSVRDDSTNVKVSYDIQNATTSGNYLNINNVFSPVLVENHFYDLHLYVDYNFWNTNYNLWNLDTQIWNEESTQTEDIFKDKIFCTDQDVDQLDFNDYYQLNKGQYIEYNGFNNTYIVR